MFKARCAGHEWNDERIDSQCINNRSGVTHGDYAPGEPVPCLMTRATLFTATEADVDKPGLAHVSSLTRSEYIDICEQRKIYEEHCERLMAALRQVCG